MALLLGWSSSSPVWHPKPPGTWPLKVSDLMPCCSPHTVFTPQSQLLTACHTCPPPSPMLWAFAHALCTCYSFCLGHFSPLPLQAHAHPLKLFLGIIFSRKPLFCLPAPRSGAFGLPSVMAPMSQCYMSACPTRRCAAQNH